MSNISGKVLGFRKLGVGTMDVVIARNKHTLECNDFLSNICITFQFIGRTLSVAKIMDLLLRS